VQWIGLTVGYSMVSALVPVVNAELFLVGLMTRQPQLAWWLVGLAAAAGQMLGKLVYYYAGRGALWLPARLRRRSERQSAGRWSRRLDWFQQTCLDRPLWTIGVLLASASIGLPPYLAIALLAGVGRVPLPTFLITGLVGRFARFGAIAASPALVTIWWF
jgi:membrane protein YqaA with SNARE-associated domain